MWVYLSSLHPMLPYTLSILILIAIVIISLKGKLMIKWGKTVIGIGRSEAPVPREPGTTDSPIPIPFISNKKKRSCKDCMLILTNEYDKHNLTKKVQEDKVLTKRMNYTEEKLTVLESDITALYEKRLSSLASEKNRNTRIESKMFFGVLREVISNVKKEIRRSCKEDDFYELPETEFAKYVTDKAKLTISIMIRELKLQYPSYDALVPIDTVIMDIESMTDIIHGYIKDIYEYANVVVKDNEKEVKEMEKKYQRWASNFLN